MKSFPLSTLYIKRISLLLCSGLVLAMPCNAPLASSAASAKQKVGKAKVLQRPSASFSIYNDIVAPLFPALKI